MTVAARLLRNPRRSLLWWSAGVVALELFTVALFLSVKDRGSGRRAPRGSAALLSLDEGVPLTSAPGYLQGRLFGSMLPLVLPVFGIGLGARAIAGSGQGGTLELLLANPITRGAVVLQRYVALVATIAALTLVFAVSLVVLGVPFGARQDVSPTGLARACFGAFVMRVYTPTIAFGVGAATGPWASARGTATTLAWRATAPGTARAHRRSAAPVLGVALALVSRPEHAR